MITQISPLTKLGPKCREEHTLFLYQISKKSNHKFLSKSQTTAKKDKLGNFRLFP